MKEGVEGSSGAVEGRLILQDPSIISLTPAHLQTLATVAQSPQAIHLMLDSGFPLLLVHGILGKAFVNFFSRYRIVSSKVAEVSITRADLC